MMLLLMAIVVLSSPATTLAAEESQMPVIITEVQMTGASAAEEFIELYNPNDLAIDLSSVAAGHSAWKLQFYNSTAIAKGEPDWTKPTTTLTLSGTIEAHSYFIISSKNYAPSDYEPDLTYTDRMASTGGALQLTEMPYDTADVLHDRVKWSSADTRPAGTWAAPAHGGSMQRVTDGDGEYADDETTPVMFMNADSITPGLEWIAPPITAPSEEESLLDDEHPADEPAELTDPEQNAGLSAAYITELLPNPGAPGSDEADEFIELYNPNDRPFMLKGYSLQAGISRVYTFQVTSDITIPAYGYIALYSDDTRLALSNTESQARLLDTSGIVISETAKYADAKDDMAWVLNGDSWQWSTTITPAKQNEITSTAVTAASAATTAASKKATAKTAAAKVKGKTSAKAKSTKAKTVKAKKEQKPKVASLATVVQEPQRSMIHTEILVGVAGLAVLYGAYEYRHDIANRIHRLRGHRAVRR